MVHFVLQAGGEQVVQFGFVDRAVEILPARVDFRRAGDLGIDFGDRQAAFAIDRQVFADRRQHRVDEYAGFFSGRLMGVAVAAVRGADFGFGVGVVGLQIDHQHAQGHADLDRGEADAGGIIHGVEHVGDEVAQRLVKRFDGCRDLLEARIGDFEDFADSHGGLDNQPWRNSQGCADQPTGRRARKACARVPSSR